MNRGALDKSKQEQNEERKRKIKIFPAVRLAGCLVKKGQMSQQRNLSLSGELKRKQHQANAYIGTWEERKTETQN